MLPADGQSSVFGERLLEFLRRYGYGVLGKPQPEAVIFCALKEASPEFRSSDAFRRAELLQMPDTTHLALNRRAAVWLSTPD